MPVEILKAEDVMRSAGKNAFRAYPTRTKGIERLRPYPTINMKGSFQFSETSKIFTTGSCFARNIEKALNFIGMNVVSSPDNLEFPVETQNPTQMFNKYTVHSILNEFTWALSDNPPAPEDLIYEVGEGKYLDMQINKDATGTKEEVVALRKGFNDTFKAAADADVIIMTMGLVECWFDTELGVYLNMAPPRGALKRYPDRFEYHTLSYEDIYEALTKINALLHKHSSTPPKILCTVSPVPLQITFRDQDILSANCYSKSVQRAAVDAFCHSHDADYFPSYELVTLADTRYAWIEHDFRHVRQEAIDRIMAQVLKVYMGESAGQAMLEARGEAMSLFKSGRYRKVVEIIEAYEEKYGDAFDILKLRLANSYWKLGYLEKALAAYKVVVEQNGEEVRHAQIAIEKIAGKIAKNAAKNRSEVIDPKVIQKQEALDKLGDLHAQLGENLDLDWLVKYVGLAAAPAEIILDEDSIAIQELLKFVTAMVNKNEFRRVQLRCNEGLENWPNEARLHWYRAWALDRQDMLEDALKDYLVVVELGGEHAEDALSRAKIIAVSLDMPNISEALAAF